MEERVARLVVDVVEVLREVRAMREEVAEELRALRGDVAEERGEGAAGDARVLAVAFLCLVVGLGHLVQGWWGRRGGRQQDGGGQGEALVEVVTLGRTEETAAPAVAGEGDLERVEVVREGGATGEEGVDGRGGVGRGGRVRGEAGGVRGEAAEWWRCLLVSRL